MDLETFVLRLQPWRAKHKRTAYAPKLGKGFHRSRFGGRPEMSPGEPWPSCAECESPMSFLLQLELTALPRRPAGDGLLQLFYCGKDDGCSTWEPFSGTQLVRLVNGDLKHRSPAEGSVEQPLRTIVGWDPVDDYPGTQEMEELGLRFDYDFRSKKVHVTCQEVGFDEANLDMEIYTAEAVTSARTGDKLFGWPHWVQGAEYPACPECGTRMELVFQVDSEQGVEIMFGDVGVGHITQCPNHPGALAFGWACS